MQIPRRFGIRTLLALTTLVALAAFVLHVRQAMFHVDALLYVRAQSRPGSSPPIHWPGYEKADYATLMRDQIHLARSPEILKRALAREEIASAPFVRRLKNPEKWLSERLQVGNPDDSEILRISIAGNRRRENQDACAAIVAAVAEEYSRRANDPLGDRVRILVLRKFGE